MFTTKLYQNKDNNLVAIVFEDGQYSNYVPCPEIVALEADSFLEEARLGFPDAIPYEYDSMVGLTMEKAAALEEQESILIAQMGEKIIVYPQRMSQESQEFFQIELGEEVWQELLEQVSGNEGIQLDI
jgi:hypothetical protein